METRNTPNTGSCIEWMSATMRLLWMRNSCRSFARPTDSSWILSRERESWLDVDWDVPELIKRFLHCRPDRHILVQHRLRLLVRTFRFERQQLVRQLAYGVFDFSFVDAEGPGAFIYRNSTFINQIIELHGDALRMSFGEPKANRPEYAGEESRVHLLFHRLVNDTLVDQILKRPQAGNVRLRFFDRRVEVLELFANRRILAIDLNIVRAKPVHKLVRQNLSEEGIERNVRQIFG